MGDKIDAIILAGGFAKRLWPLTRDRPKPLLFVGEKPVIEYTMDRLVRTKKIKNIYISTNKKFGPQFEEWLGEYGSSEKIEVVVEPTMHEGEKFGSIGALGFLIKKKGITGDILVIAGDNLFDFDIGKIVEEGEKGNAVVALYDMVDKEKVMEKYGIVVLDEDGTIKEFHEKPKEPHTALASTGCYFFPKETLVKISEYLHGGNHPDAPGFFISWLIGEVPVKGLVFGGKSRWFDIGSVESYREANEEYSEKQET